MKRTYLLATLTIGASFFALSGCTKSSETTAEASATTSAAAKNGSRIATSIPAARKVTAIPVGTALRVRTTSTLSTESATSGETFRATLAEPLIVDGRQLAPAGADVDALVVNADQGGRVKGVASISIRPTKLHLDSGPVAISTGAYTKEARTTKKADGVKVGIGAGIGAAIGAIAGGGKGAAIGAATGAGAGTGVVLATHGEPAVIAAESLVTFRLTSPVTID